MIVHPALPVPNKFGPGMAGLLSIVAAMSGFHLRQGYGEHVPVLSPKGAELKVAQAKNGEHLRAGRRPGCE